VARAPCRRFRNDHELTMDNSGKWFDDILVGDTFGRSVTIGLVPKPSHGGEIVELTAIATNQDGVIAVEADGKVLAANRT
jgi:hypothetical protein